ncbi:hypothetical protein PCANC_02886 [Puccinia coronata f. sp. avenae]|uniref:Uncharacterized protein n=1 Tax=Puccinia coronata f. sp. avenae TaxID=200324 RepID=A0A2N5T8F7_9BASI|nr:hypothetical protein PCANC_02886 [Puccinia coronata f. sp. avenae]
MLIATQTCTQLLLQLVLELSRDLPLLFYCASTSKPSLLWILENGLSKILAKFSITPESIICTLNAAKRSAAHLVGRLHHRVQQQAAQSRLPPLPPSPPPTSQSSGLQDPVPPPQHISPPLLPPAVAPVVLSTPPQYRITLFHPLDLTPSPFLCPPPGRSAMSSKSNNDKTDYLQMLMEMQHNQLLQAQQDCAVSAKRMT